MKITTKFDRLDPNPPEYLERLRNKGHWRNFHLGSSEGWDLLSNALSQVRIGQMKQLGGTFLDAGCGESPDAILATKLLGFDKAIKVDLWPPYVNSRSAWSIRLKRLESKAIRFVRADVCSMKNKVATESISMVGSNAMIDLIKVEDRPLFYEEVWRVLKPGGIFSVSWVPLAAGYGWGDGWDEIRAMQKLGFKHVNRGHYNSIVMTKQ